MFVGPPHVDVRKHNESCRNRNARGVDPLTREPAKPRSRMVPGLKDIFPKSKGQRIRAQRGYA
jgi:hypothetical protein